MMYLFITAALAVNILILILLYRLAISYKYRDYMTQLYNKAYLEKIVTKWIVGKKDFTICFFDIDKFKMLNDTYGHLAGDKGIIHLSGALRECFEGKAIVARIGGDEFAAAFMGHSEKRQEELFNRLRAHSYNYNGKTISFTVSIGVCQSDRELSYEKLLDLTDKKLYDSKKSQEINPQYAPSDAPFIC